MLCLPEDLTTYTALIDSCVLTITDADSKLRYLFHLSDTTIIERSDNNVLIKDDDGSRISLTPTQMTDLGLTVPIVLDAIKACQSGGEPSVTPTDGSAIIGCSLNGENTFVVQVKYDESTSLWEYTLSNGTPVVEGVDFIVCENSNNTSKITTICKCDDVNEDGTDIVQFTEAYFIESDGTTLSSTLLGLFTDESLTTGYVLQGINVECDSMGSDAKILQKRIELTNGQNWSPTLTTQSYTIRVNGTGASFSDSDSNVTPLVDGEVLTFSNEEYDLFDDVPNVGSTGASIFITYTELG